MARTNATPKVDEFNERVYAELFLTPRSDPWLGLVPAEAYTALPENGLKRGDESVDAVERKTHDAVDGLERFLHANGL